MLKRIFKHNFSIGSRSAVCGVPFVVDDSAVAGATDVSGVHAVVGITAFTIASLLQKCCLNLLQKNVVSTQLQ
jgi:hypothetical protein